MRCGSRSPSEVKDVWLSIRRFWVRILVETNVLQTEPVRILIMYDYKDLKMPAWRSESLIILYLKREPLFKTLLCAMLYKRLKEWFRMCRHASICLQRDMLEKQWVLLRILKVVSSVDRKKDNITLIQCFWLILLDKNRWQKSLHEGLAYLILLIFILKFPFTD